MSEWIRPGPLCLDPGRAPGGVVFHLYDVATGSLILERPLGADMEVEKLGAWDAEMAGRVASESGLCLVVFDGDTGERWPAEEIRRAMPEGWSEA